MKRTILFSAALLAFVSQLSATIISTNFTSGFASGGFIPDNNESGWVDSRTLSGYDGLTVQSVEVTLNISGGWNGDLYGYLVHDSGFVVLLNRVGKDETHPFGYGEAGFDGVTLSDNSSLTSIQNYGGSYSATSALSGGTYNSSAGTLDSAFTGLDVNGSWSLFFADQSSGDTSQVTGWTLTINAVPEPTTWAMIFFAAAFGGWQFIAWRKKLS